MTLNQIINYSIVSDRFQNLFKYLNVPVPGTFASDTSDFLQMKRIVILIIQNVLSENDFASKFEMLGSLCDLYRKKKD